MLSRRTERLLQASIVVLFLALVWVISRSLEERVVAVGDTAPDFTIVTDSGKRVTRSDFGGKLLVLNFWATWCPPCVEEMPSLDQFQKQLSPAGVVVLGVSVDRSDRVYRQFLQSAKVSFLTARDPDAKIPTEYGTFKYPETYVIDSNGKVREKFVGPEVWTNPEVIRRIRALM